MITYVALHFWRGELRAQRLVSRNKALTAVQLAFALAVLAALAYGVRHLLLRGAVPVSNVALLGILAMALIFSNVLVTGEESGTRADDLRAWALPRPLTSRAVRGFVITTGFLRSALFTLTLIGAVTAGALSAASSWAARAEIATSAVLLPVPPVAAALWFSTGRSRRIGPGFVTVPLGLAFLLTAVRLPEPHGAWAAVAQTAAAPGLTLPSSCCSSPRSWRLMLRTPEAGRPHQHDAPAATDASVLQVAGLSARYDGPDVFTDVSLTLRRGETVRVTGPNGAGKSTLLRCLTGVHPPRTGLVRVRGTDLAAHPVEAKRHIGYAAGDIPFTYLTGREHLELGVRVYRLPRSAADAVLNRFSGWALTRAIDTESRRYSHGMRQQLKLLLAILHNPSLLVLDEAAEGLDDQALTDWLGYLADRSTAGGSLVYVEHRDEVALRFPASRRLELSDTDITEGEDAGALPTILTAAEE